MTTTNGQQRVGPGIYITAYTRTVITCARLEGLTRPGEAAAGLPDDFGLLKEDVPRKDRGDVPDRPGGGHAAVATGPDRAPRRPVE